jgi:predicted  nucleic acid-binding Zn-ribbon protein
VSLEWFSRLKEYDSLSKARLGESNAIKEQELRLKALELRREESLTRLTELKAEHVRLHQELLELEEKLKIQTQQRQRWIDQGGADDRRLKMEEDIAVLEEKGFAQLENLETNETERKEVQTFLDGLTKTIGEINGEVKAEILLHQEKIKQLDLRLEGLLEILPDEFKTLLLKLLKKNLAHGPFTRIDSGSCFFCRYKISRIDESEIDMQKKLKTCPQCGRIFIPYGT